MAKGKTKSKPKRTDKDRVVQVNLRIPASLKRRLFVYAAQNDTKPSHVVRELLDKFLGSKNM